MEGLDYDSVRSKIRTILPQTAVVGMLLEHEERYDVIKSNQSGLFSARQLLLGGYGAELHSP